MKGIFLRKGSLLAGVALMSSVIFAAPASAQQADTQPQGDADSDGSVIIVTATLRAERLEDVPIAVSAIGEDEIANRGASALGDLQAAVPALRLVDIGPGSQRIQLRGVSQFQGLPTVGNYVDEFSINNIGASGVPEIQLFDMQRVEVLRGPQPVLYGEGSMGGTIRYISRDPSLNEIEIDGLGEVSFIKGGETGFRAQAGVSIPIAPGVAGIRLAGMYNDAGGWTDGPPGKDINGIDTRALQVKLVLEPSTGFKASLLGIYSERSQAFKSYSFDGENTTQRFDSLAKQKFSLGNLVLEYDAGSFTLLSSTGYLDSDGRSIDDSGPFFNELFGAPLLVNALSDSIGNTAKFSQELRLTSNGNGPLSYLFGAVYTDTDVNGIIIGTGESAVPGLPAEALGVVFNVDQSAESKTWALYGNLGYKLTDWLTFEAGGRYFRDKRSLTSDFQITGFPASSVFQDSASFDTFNPRVSLTADTGSGIFFISAAKGFRSGGFNGSGAPLELASFDPEDLWTYEAGTKLSLIDDTLFVEASVYYNDYKNVQTNDINPNNPGQAIAVNSGEASGLGFDFGFRAKPSRDFSVMGSFGYNNMRFDTDTVSNIKGDPLDLVPDVNVSLAVDWTPQLNDGVELISHFDINFTDEAKITLRSLTFPTAIEESQSRVAVNGKIGALIDDRFEVYGFVRNLFDERRIVLPSFGAFFEPIFTHPRTFGIGLRVRG
ncbi:MULTISPECIES: TonB-dependent receptor [unclassified Sphingopyxis]|uniref:TonB-dependent receptor n=1 Tax=unclassified Sphingopyxis TaxID=2614943 RepID=UPI001F611A15|nr:MULTISPECIES: TonB-dependent receptor [unclassified Sphingopyxis]USI76608.1 TonB-dependent receptor [Sphingopyxis sp. USTB-05]